MIKNERGETMFAKIVDAITNPKIVGAIGLIFTLGGTLLSKTASDQKVVNAASETAAETTKELFDQWKLEQGS